VAALRGVGGARKYFAAIRALDFDLDDVIHALFELQARRVVPQVFEAVEFAFAWMEDVDDHASEIRDDPLAEWEAVHAKRADAVFLSHGLGDFAGDGFELWLGCAGADDEEICECGNAPKVHDDDVLGFFVGSDLCAETRELF
jgi:hypothetical protein